MVKKPVITPVPRMVWMKWIDQIVADARQRASINTKLDETTLEAFAAGVREGCQQAMSTLKLHGHAAVSDLGD